MEDSMTLTPLVSDLGGAQGLVPYQEGPPLSTTTSRLDQCEFFDFLEYMKASKTSFVTSFKHIKLDLYTILLKEMTAVTS